MKDFNSKLIAEKPNVVVVYVDVVDFALQTPERQKAIVGALAKHGKCLGQKLPATVIQVGDALIAAYWLREESKDFRNIAVKAVDTICGALCDLEELLTRLEADQISIRTAFLIGNAEKFINVKGQEDIVGPSINEAKRVCEVAQKGQILVTAEIKEILDMIQKIERSQHLKFGKIKTIWDKHSSSHQASNLRFFSIARSRWFGTTDFLPWWPWLPWWCLIRSPAFTLLVKIVCAILLLILGAIFYFFYLRHSGTFPIPLPADYDQLPICAPTIPEYGVAFPESLPQEITCFVRDRTTNNPVEGARIYFAGMSMSNLSISRMITTGKGGSAQITEELPEGLYNIWVDAKGYPKMRIGQYSPLDLKKGLCQCLLTAR